MPKLDYYYTKLENKYRTGRRGGAGRKEREEDRRIVDFYFF